MIKILLYISILLNLTLPFVNEQDFDTSILKVIKKISADLNSKTTENLQVAIYPFKYNKENENVLAEYVTEEFWDLLPEFGEAYTVVDRSTFEEYFKEHKLKSKGLIDPSTEKQFGMLLAADVYVSGKVYVFNSYIRLKVSVTDTETGEIISTASGKLPITYDIANHIGLKDWKEKKEEAERNKSTNPNCSNENVGDFCFQNNSNLFYQIKIQDINKTLSTTYRAITLDKKSSKCFKDLPNGAYAYSVSEKDSNGIIIKKGNFYVSTCHSSLFEID